jgi:spore coat protein CotH
MKRVILLTAALLLTLVQGGKAAEVPEGTLVLRTAGTNALVQIRGEANDDWRLQASSDLATWEFDRVFGTLLSGENDAPQREVANGQEAHRFFRAIKTGGLYDRTLLRTMRLTFTQANWPTLLTSGRTSGSNTLCTLEVDNGAILYGVGARYRGNTSFTGMGGSAPVKKSINLELDWTNSVNDLMGYETLNLNNAFQDETIMRESLFFNIMRHYTVCPAGAMVQLYINNANWGVYSHAQQQNGDLIREYFPSNKGHRWRAPNMGGGGPSGGTSALTYLNNTNLSTYQNLYELKSDPDTNALPLLIQVIYVLNTTTTDFRNKVEEVLAVDRWLWFLALENVFADDDSYWNKGADYMMYYEPESGRLHPVEHDGNEAFVAGDTQLSPVRGATDANRPVLRRLLSEPELRQRYLAHMRTVLEEFFNPDTLTPLIQEYVALSVDAIAADPKKGYTSMLTYTNDLRALQTFVTNRFKFLTNHTELRPLAPIIDTLSGPSTNPLPTATVSITADVRPDGTNGIDSVWLWHRTKSYGRFWPAEMLDDGAHDDGASGDGVFGATITNYPAGTKVRYYVEARSANASRAAAFSPARAEQETLSYRVGLTTAASTPVVINELMADNQSTIRDPQGEFDDWIEIHNLSEEAVLMTGRYLTDDPTHPRKWKFPDGVSIPADGYLLVWADEDGSDTPGLHASFKLAKSGEAVYLIDTDENFNAVLDHVPFGEQAADVSFGRSATDQDTWKAQAATPGQPNGG